MSMEDLSYAPSVDEHAVRIPRTIAELVAHNKQREKELETMRECDGLQPPIRQADLTQVGGSHYKDVKVQPWAAMESWMPYEEFAGFLRGNAIKYLARAGKKGAALEDIKKARHYLDKLVEVMEAA